MDSDLSDTTKYGLYGSMGWRKRRSDQIGFYEFTGYLKVVNFAAQSLWPQSITMDFQLLSGAND